MNTVFNIKITKVTPLLFAILITLVIFLESLNNNFCWDDKYLIEDNPYVKSWQYSPKIFTTQLYEGGKKESNYYRPFQLISYLIDYSIWGLNPFGYHLTSLAFHLLNIALVYFIIIVISGSMPISFLAAFLFGVSPISANDTYYIASRANLLMAFFMLLAILLFILYKKKKLNSLYISSIISFIASLLCREQAVILPFLIFITDRFYAPHKKKRPFLLLLPYLSILAAYLIFRLTLLNFSEGPNPLIGFSYPATIPLWRRVLTGFKIILIYLRMLLFPQGLHMEWFVKPANSILEAGVLLSILAFGLLVFSVKRLSDKHRLILFGALWFILGLLPVLNIYPLGVFLGQGWLYFPSVGFFIMFSIILYKTLIHKIGKLPSRILIIFFITLYSVFSFSYIRPWKDSISIFENILKYEEKNPFIFKIYNNLALAFYEKGDFEKCIEVSEKGIAKNPSYAPVYNTMALGYAGGGRLIKAMSCLRRAISLKRDYIDAYSNLALMYGKLGLRDRSIYFAKEALLVDANCAKAYCVLGYMFEGSGDIDGAIGFFKEASRIEEAFYEPHYCLGKLYARLKKFELALEEYGKASRFREWDYKFYNELGFLYLKNRRAKEAERAFFRAIYLNANQADSYNHLGNLYRMAGYPDLSMEYHEKALEISPASKADE